MIDARIPHRPKSDHERIVEWLKKINKTVQTVTEKVKDDEARGKIKLELVTLNSHVELLKKELLRYEIRRR